MLTNTTGDFNTAVGRHAGTSRTNINYGTFVGFQAYANSNNLTNITGIGYNARPTQSNQVRIGNSNVTRIGGFSSWSNLSDERYKANLSDDVKGLELFMKLRPLTYNLAMDKLADKLGEDLGWDQEGNSVSKSDANVQKARAEKASVRYRGFLAAEVEEAARSVGYEFSGVDAPQTEDGLNGIRYAEFVVPIVKAIQVQQEQIRQIAPEGTNELKEELNALRM